MGIREIHTVLMALGPRDRMRHEIKTLRRFLKSIGCRRVRLWVADGVRHCVYVPPRAAQHIKLPPYIAAEIGSQPQG